MVAPESSVTAMSGRLPGETLNFKQLTRLARASLPWLLMGIGGQSCLITSSPDLQAPTRTVPFLTSMSPALYQVHSLTSTPGAAATTTVEFDVTSEDLGQPLEGVLLLDFPGFGVPYTKPVLQDFTIAPGHLGDEARHFRSRELDFDPDSPGCHWITLLLTHQFKGRFTIEPEDSTDLAPPITWWYEIDDTQLGLGSQLQRCASGGTPNIDAGSDASSKGDAQ